MGIFGSGKKKKNKSKKGDAVTPTAPLKADVLADRGDNEGTPLVASPVVAVPVTNAEELPLRMTTRVSTTTVRGGVRFEDDRVGCILSMLLNVVWIVFGGGIPVAVLYLLGGILFCISIIGFPCGLQLLKIARLALFPFGNAIASYERQNGKSAGSVNVDCFCHNIGNILFLPLSVALLVVHLIAALICACTIVGIPFSYAHLKLASLAVCPFGRDQDNRKGQTITTTTTTTTTTNDYGGLTAAQGGGYQSVV